MIYNTKNKTKFYHLLSTTSEINITSGFPRLGIMMELQVVCEFNEKLLSD